MKKPISDSELSELPGQLRLVFAPLDKRALGLAVGVLVGGGLFLVTAYHILFDGMILEKNAEFAARYEYSGDPLWLLAFYFKGYDPTSWGGAVMGLFWGAWTGFVVGWFFAFVRNFTFATWLFFVRTRERLAANREFLDHI